MNRGIISPPSRRAAVPYGLLGSTTPMPAILGLPQASGFPRPVADAIDSSGNSLAPLDYTDRNGVQWRAHVFTSNGTIRFTVGGDVEYLIVAGGGGGGGISAAEGSGGGGGGGFRTNVDEEPLRVTAGSYAVVVGAGGSGVQTLSRVAGQNGGNSSVFGITSVGGGGGGPGFFFATRGQLGGSGGGGGRTMVGTASESNNGAETRGQGNRGGEGSGGPSTNNRNGGGGGGAGLPGVPSTTTQTGGGGGAGAYSEITGTLRAYAGGGAGGRGNAGSDPGGIGGGGAVATNGTVATGGGGGGAGNNVALAGNGGSGIVVVRYRSEAAALHPEATQWLSSVYASGASASPSTALAVSRFCAAIDAAGLRDRFYRLNLFCGTGLSAALVPLYRGQSLGGTQFGNATDTNVNFAAGDYVETGATGGLVGNGSTKRLATGTDPVAAGISNTDTHLGFYSRAQITANNCVIGSFGGGVPQSTWQCLAFGGLSQMYYRSGGGSNSGIEAVSWSGANRSGHIVVQRTNNDAKLYRNGTDLNVAVNTTNSNNWTSVTPRAPFVFARNNVETADQIIAATLQGYSMGLSFSDAQASAFGAAMVAFQTALGRN